MNDRAAPRRAPQAPAAAAGADREPNLAPARPGDLRRSVIEPSRPERELGWRAKTPLADGIARTVEALK